jgi:hypothetical protein
VQARKRTALNVYPPRSVLRKGTSAFRTSLQQDVLQADVCAGLPR